MQLPDGTSTGPGAGEGERKGAETLANGCWLGAGPATAHADVSETSRRSVVERLMANPVHRADARHASAVSHPMVGRYLAIVCWQ